MKDYDNVEFETIDLGNRSDTPLTIEDIHSITSEEGLKESVEEFVDTLGDKSMDEITPVESGLLSFYYAGKFGKKISEEYLVEYSQFILLEFNNIDMRSFESRRRIAIKCSYSAMVFKGSLRNSLCILVPVNSGLEHHDFAFGVVGNYYENLLHLIPNDKTKDILYSCTVSYDKDCFYIGKFCPFKIVEEDIVDYDELDDDELDYDEPANELDEKLIKQLESTVIFTENREKFAPGKEKVFIKLFSINCNNMGYDVDDVVKYSKMKFRSKNYSEVEMEKDIRFIYTVRKDEFGSRQKYAKSVKNKTGNSAPIIEGLDSKLEEFRSFLISYFDDENKVGFAITYLKGLLK